MINYPVIISFCNDGYYLFAINMLINLNTTIKNHKVHFYCLDTNIYEKLQKLPLQNINVTFELFTKYNLSANYNCYYSLEFNLLTHAKTFIIKDALAKYNFIHFIDCDVVCVKEPELSYYNKYKDYDIIFQHDAGMYSADKLHAPTLHHIWTCTGNTTFNNTSGAHFILDKIIEYQNDYKNKNDQDCLYQYFQDIQLTDITKFEHAKLYTYPIDEYTNGYWLNNDIGTLENTYFFHANHVEGPDNKINLLRKAGKFYLIFN